MSKRPAHVGRFLLGAGLFFLLASAAPAQSGRQTYKGEAATDDTDKVATEEIKLNVSALGENGSFKPGVGLNDLLILEDGILHPPASVRRIPANILILLDTGGEDRQAKDFRTTREAAKALIRMLSPDDTVALLEVNDQARVITEWTSDKEQLVSALDKQLRFGNRSRLVDGLKLSKKAFLKWGGENRHLVLITDGLESLATERERDAAMDGLLETDVSVHAVSYTRMEQDVVTQRRRSVTAGNPKLSIPPGGNVPVQGQTQTGTLGTVNLDRAMIRKINERAAKLANGEKALKKVADSSSGEFLNPATREEMVAQMEMLSRIIDSNYVVTYVPKRPLADSPNGEERSIEVTSRRYDVLVQAKRKLIVRKAEVGGRR